MPIPVTMPALSPTMEEGTLAKWSVKEGDKVGPGDVIAEIETDKATMEVEAVDEGTVGQLLVDEGTEGVPVNKVIAVLLEEGEDKSALDNFDPEAASPAPKKAAEEKPEPKEKKEAKPEEKPAAKPAAKKEEAAPEKPDGKRIFASPLAKRIAEDKGIDLAALSGSGPRGRIVKKDVEEAKPGTKAAAASAGGPSLTPSVDPRAFFEKGTYEEVPMDKMRKTIAKRLTQSKQEIPHYYLTVDCEIDELLRVRKELNERAPEGVKLSVNDFLIRAAALALKKVPEVNASFAGDNLLMHKHANVGIAVAIEGGLITPIINKADEKGLAAISNESKDLAARARDRKLKPQEYEGGSFSISNLGMYGIKNFTAVINPPQSAILAVGAGEKRAVVKGDELVAATMMTCTMSCDHRVIDGALGARFLDAFKGFVEFPATMLM
ncbi:pyruvate dehydrogenase complex dihydrolipoamide acetyltransferase [Tepidicaulis marinus]|uniref:Acetyltransferase component of pyruvate dehydrogenase complex n=1 Tax=Tepidicaulis marinus TaxID=1333998 RepID=A0A081B8X5_9HYPH|nr:pyruvate dehydrogenase complex dihydrolipoamide acetyltransferase [Tepidicaulis marinus]GAK44493.1 pyruvate dehydrogenase complex dihydrolipoamide acetyltransferase [Tepidicaulis marinus]